MQLNRNGFLYVLDRANGKLISAKPFEKVNWATHVDMETGRPVETEMAKKVRAGEQIELWPRSAARKNWPHAAFNPETGLLYANTMHRGRTVQAPAGDEVTGRPALSSSSRTCPTPRTRASRSAISMRSIR